MISEVKLYPINDHHTMARVVDAAFENGVNLIKADYVAMRGDEVVGSIGISPMIFWWGHTERMRTLDSYAMYAGMDAIMKAQGHNAYYIPCEKSSPYHKLLSVRLPMLDSMKGETDWSIFISE